MFRWLSTFSDMFNLEKEDLVITRNGVVTKVTVYFNTNGTPVGATLSSSKETTKAEELQKQIEEAVEKEDYSLAAQLKKEKDSL
ncbi:MAG: hypothetical protein E6Q36_08130 [Chryseobacterium sp.]|nr:MAG: hypothetical protein E6Q36_08130 [Chryseobacterium sp.]